MAQVSLPGDKFNTLAENRRLIFWILGSIVAALAVVVIIKRKK